MNITTATTLQRKLRAALLAALALVAVLPASAQEYRFEVGPALGVVGYLGDVNNSNVLKSPGLAGGAVFRYIHNSRWAVKANLLYQGIKGNSADIDTRFPGTEPYEFKSSLVDLGVQAEFNFLNFGMGARYKNYKRISPYMVLGLGAVASMVDGGGTHFTVNLPMGVGVKYKLKERLNLGFEVTMRKSFGDQLDGISDLNLEQHGFAKNTDWTGQAVFTITYEFSKRCVKCHYVD